ncbi:hypothetical protein OG21DRAFT_396056 [Imleria badia]|nr:hypothetical protein OG21DRAFT_396056 [Imleria badia]
MQSWIHPRLRCLFMDRLPSRVSTTHLLTVTRNKAARNQTPPYHPEDAATRSGRTRGSHNKNSSSRDCAHATSYVYRANIARSLQLFVHLTDLICSPKHYSHTTPGSSQRAMILCVLNRKTGSRCRLVSAETIDDLAYTFISHPFYRGLCIRDLVALGSKANEKSAT